MEAKRVVIFGAGPTGARAVEKYKGLVDIVAVADNNPAKWGVSLGGQK